VLEVVHLFLGNFIKLSAPVHGLSCWQKEKKT